MVDNPHEVSVYKNVDGRFYLRRDNIPGSSDRVWGDGGHWWPSGYSHRIKYFWSKSSAIRAAKRLEEKARQPVQRPARRAAFVDQKVWR